MKRRPKPEDVAEREVRSTLEMLQRRHQRLAELCQPGRRAGGNARAGRESAAIVRLTSSLLQHLDAEVKQARTDAAILAEGNPAIP